MAALSRYTSRFGVLLATLYDIKEVYMAFDGTDKLTFQYLAEQ